MAENTLVGKGGLLWLKQAWAKPLGFSLAY